jgi:hypothetical protein
MLAVLGGALTVESEPGAFTRVIVEMPASGPSAGVVAGDGSPRG